MVPGTTNTIELEIIAKTYLAIYETSMTEFWLVSYILKLFQYSRPLIEGFVLK